MGKPDGHPRTDLTIVPSFGKYFTGPSSKPPNGNHEFLSDLSSAVVKLEGLNTHDSANQHQLNKIETDPTNGFRNSSHIKFEPISELDWNQSPPDTKREKEPSKQEDSSSQQEPNRGFTPGHGSVLVLMSCLSCYTHVMVSGANPKCPKCGKGDCLLDMFRASPVKIESTI